MTTSTDVQLPAITCPSSLIASCPPLLGFHPESSLICVAYRPGSTQPAIARIDLVDDAHAADCAAGLAQRLVRTGSSHVAVVLWAEAPDGTQRPQLPGVALVEHLDEALALVGVTISLAVATNNRVWWPLLCASSTCCSDQPHPIDADVAGRIRMQYAVAGFAPVGTRGDLAERLTADPRLVDRTRRHLADAGRGSRSLAHRRRQVDQLWRVLRPLARRGRAAQDCDPDWHLELPLRSQPRWPTSPPGARSIDVASPEAAVRALGDVGVRDALLVRFAEDETSCRACWQHSVAVLVDVVRASPPGHVAPAATVLGLVSWLSGDGAFATVAVVRALDDDPRYRLALLADQLFGSGVTPWAWRSSTTGLSEEDCLRSTSRTSRAGRR